MNFLPVELIQQPKTKRKNKTNENKPENSRRYLAQPSPKPFSAEN